MRTQVKQPQSVSHTIQSKTKASRQAPIEQILQRYKDKTVQRESLPEEDELLQGKFETTQLMDIDEEEPLQGKFATAQRAEMPDEDELLQGKFETTQREESDDEGLLQGKLETAQREELPEEDELLQAKFNVAQRAELDDEKPLQAKAENRTGLPDNLKSGIENMSGFSMDTVRVHYNSPKPAQLQALAYTQGTDIHVAPGQEKQLPHEAWHVVQQKQGRVEPTMQLQGVNINDNEGLEKEADVMGSRTAFQFKDNKNTAIRQGKIIDSIEQAKGVTAQRRKINGINTANFTKKNYEKKDYNSVGFGHFDAKYQPKNKKLDITLPVYFQKGNIMPNEEKKYFLNNVKSTWSQKYRITTTATSKGGGPIWQNNLNFVNVNVMAVEKNDNAEAYFKIGYNTKDEDWVGGNQTVELSQQGYAQTKESWNKAPIPAPVAGKYNVYGHEAGHMFGLDDEYEGAKKRGYKSDHYRLTRKAFGKKYANKYAKQYNDKNEESIMNEGTEVRKHHYVTFWDAMVQAIQAEPTYGNAPSKIAPNQHADWKID